MNYVQIVKAAVLDVSLARTHCGSQKKDNYVLGCQNSISAT